LLHHSSEGYFEAVETITNIEQRTILGDCIRKLNLLVINFEPLLNYLLNDNDTHSH
jgi:hypothetical protein